MIKDYLQSEIKKVVTKLFPEAKDIEIDINPSPSKEFGDLSTPIALTLSKLAKQDPLSIANAISKELDSSELIDNVSTSKPGFINFRINYQNLFATTDTKIELGRPQNITVEHTSVNPNKSAHIGHLRNACLGDSLARILKFAGHQVEIQNYIDDTGVQVADIVWGEQALNKTWEKDGKNQAVDEFYWDLYSASQAFIESDPSQTTAREAVHKALEDKTSAESVRAGQLSKLIVEKHLETFANFNIHYDLLVWERDILDSKLWELTFELLKDKKVIHKAVDGKMAGTWILEFGDTEDQNKILVRSNGVPTYTAKDIAYQLWKFGKAPVKLPVAKCEFDKEEVESTTAPYPDAKATQYMGKADRVINVIDVGQSYTQDVLRHALAELKFTKESANSVHLSYEKVKLSAESMKALGLRIESDHESYSMSGRKGIGVKVNDLLNKTEEFISKAHPETDAEVIHELAIGAIRYYMLKFRPNREIVFDFEEAQRITGNTGIYIQYAYARANNIIRKIGEVASYKTAIDNMDEAESNLILQLNLFSEAVVKSANELDPSLIADYAFELASSFAKFYEVCPVATSEGDIKSFRVALVNRYRDIFGACLDLLGIPKLEKI